MNDIYENEEKIITEFEDSDFFDYPDDDIFIHNNETYFKGTKGDKKLLNFVMKPIYTIEDSLIGKKMKQVILKKKDRETQTVIIEKLTSPKAFEEVLTENLGGYHFFGNKKDFYVLWDYLECKYPTKTIKIFHNIGKIINENIWIFHNKIFCINEKRWISNNIEKIAFINDNLGYLLKEDEKGNRNDLISNVRLNFKNLYQQLNKYYGDECYKIIGFAVASIFRDVIFKQFGFFPILFLIGQPKSGKSTLSEIISSLVGFGKIPVANKPTLDYLRRVLQSYQNGIIQLNEYNDTYSSAILSNYDGQGKGIARTGNNNQVVSNLQTCSLLVCSEKVSNMENVISRCINVDFNKIKKFDSVGFFEDLKNPKKIDSLSFFLYQVLLKIPENEIVEEINNLRLELLKDEKLSTTDNRVIQNHAIVYACFNVFSKHFLVL